MKKIAVFFITFFLLITSIKAIDIKSNNMVLYNLNEDKIVDELNKDEKVSIASMTKIMTFLVAIENIDDLNDKVTIKKEYFDNLEEENASLAGFEIGEKVTYKDLLYGLMLPSGAEAANALAVNISGSTSSFVTLMNKKAQDLKLTNTHFNNVTGLDDVNHYSTVNDVATILKEAYKNPTFKEVFSSKSYTLSDKSLKIYSTLFKNLDYYDISADYIIGGKTGYTIDAGRCLASIAYDSKNDLYYLLVTANAPTTTSYYHLLDAKDIYDYYMTNFGYHNLVNKDETLVTLETKYAKEKKVNILSTEDIKYYLDNTFDKSKITLTYNGIKVIDYNTKLGTKLGTLDIIYDGKTLKKIDINLNTKLHFSLLSFIISNILWIILSLIIILIAFKFKKKKKRRK